MWTRRKRIRKIPVRLMITFCPREEVRKRVNQFIVDLCIKDLQDSEVLWMSKVGRKGTKGKGRNGEWGI